MEVKPRTHALQHSPGFVRCFKLNVLVPRISNDECHTYYSTPLSHKSKASMARPYQTSNFSIQSSLVSPTSRYMSPAHVSQYIHIQHSRSMTHVGPQIPMSRMLSRWLHLEERWRCRRQNQVVEELMRIGL